MEEESRKGRVGQGEWWSYYEASSSLGPKGEGFDSE